MTFSSFRFGFLSSSAIVAATAAKLPLHPCACQVCKQPTRGVSAEPAPGAAARGAPPARAGAQVPPPVLWQERARRPPASAELPAADGALIRGMVLLELN